MRALFHVLGADGHFFPMVPLARGLQDAGHDVVFVTDRAYCDSVEERGFRTRPLDTPIAMAGPEVVAASAARRGLDLLRYQLGLFLELAVENSKTIVALADDEQPDLLIRESSGWGAWLAGELLDVPVATFDFAPAPHGFMASALGERFQEARAAVGLPPDPGLGSLDRWLTIVGAPPNWFPPQCFRPTTHLVQPPNDPTAGDSLPDWVVDLPEGPTVYVTLGTVFNGSPGVFEMMLEALAEVDANVIATVGRTVDPARFAPLPDHVRVERFIPQGRLLRHCDAVVAHGGYGSLMGALRHGLPTVAIPLAAADNHLNAARIEQLGAGIAVPEGRRSVQEIRRATLAVLLEPTYRAAAKSVATDIAELPPFTRAVDLIERLAAERLPVLVGDAKTSDPR